MSVVARERTPPSGSPGTGTRSRGGTECRIVRDVEGLRELRPEWTRLYEASSPRNPCLSPEWAELCLRRLCRRAEPFVVGLLREGRLAGVAPLRRERVGGLRTLRFLGKGHSPYAGFLTDERYPEAETLVLEALGGCGSEWDLLHLTHLADGFSRLHRTPVPKPLLGKVRESHWRGAAYLGHEGEWEELCRTGPGWLRKMPARVRRFEREGTVERHVGGAAANHAAEMAHVEERSWQGRRGLSRDLAVREEALGFLKETFRALGPREEIELRIARMGGEPVAYEVNLLLPDRIWLLRGAYQEEHGKLSPGAVLDFLSIRDAWAEGRREYDFLSGDEEYKLHRTDRVRPLYELIAAPGTVRGGLALAAFAGSRALADHARPAVRRLKSALGCGE